MNVKIGVVGSFAVAALIAASTPALAQTDFSDSFDPGDLGNWTASTYANPPWGASNSQSLDTTIYQSPPTSAQLHSHASCFIPPYGGAGTSLTRTIALANGQYQLSYRVREQTSLYGYCGGGTGAGSSIVANGTNIAGAECGVGGHCGSCLVDWTTASGCFTVTDGAAQIVLSHRGGDCSDSTGWFDDITIQPAAATVAFTSFPADVAVVCNASTDPSATGTPAATATSACGPAGPASVSFSDVRTSSCPPVIERTWTATSGTASVSQVQRITLGGIAPTVLAGTTDLYCLWPPNHASVCFNQSQFAPSITEPCGAATWRFAGCTSDQPDDQGAGHTANDCVVSGDGTSFCVVAERDGPDAAGRRYGVSIVASDACGNASAPTTIGYVLVPHDQKDHPSCIAP